MFVTNLREYLISSTVEETKVKSKQFCNNLDDVYIKVLPLVLNIKTEVKK